MNLEKELQKKIIKQNVNIKDWMPVVTYEDASEIAKKYAEEMCKRQRLLIWETLERWALIQELSVQKREDILDEVLNAPLATEEK